MHHRAIAVLLLGSVLSACKDKPAPAKPPAQAAPATMEERALEEFNQRISQFKLTIHYDRGRKRFSTAVVLSVPAGDPPGENSGVTGVEFVRIPEPTARRLVQRLAQNHFLPIISLHECRLGPRPQAPVFFIAASAGGGLGFSGHVWPGPEAEARIDSIAAALEGEGAAAVRRLLTRIKLSETVVPLLKADLGSFQLRLDPSESVPRPRPALCLTVAPPSDPSADIITLQIPAEAAARIIDDLDAHEFFFRGTVGISQREAPTEPHYTLTVRAAATSPVRDYYVFATYPTLPARVEWLRRVVPEGEPADRMDDFLRGLKSKQAEAHAGITSN